MDLQKKMELLSELLELEIDDFSPETNLDDLEEWDSLAAISYVVMMDEEFGVVANPNEIKKFKTVQDILDTMN
ncbi:MAG: acyl carrier protein [Sulfurimonadaceae bacterium]|jgi:acyl carrier protein